MNKQEKADRQINKPCLSDVVRSITLKVDVDSKICDVENISVTSDVATDSLTLEVDAVLAWSVTTNVDADSKICEVDNKSVTSDVDTDSLTVEVDTGVVTREFDLDSVTFLVVAVVTNVVIGGVVVTRQKYQMNW